EVTLKNRQPFHSPCVAGRWSERTSSGSVRLGEGHCCATPTRSCPTSVRPLRRPHCEAPRPDDLPLSRLHGHRHQLAGRPHLLAALSRSRRAWRLRLVGG